MGEIYSPGRTRTADPVVNSHLLYRLSYRGMVYRLVMRILILLLPIVNKNFGYFQRATEQKLI